MKKYKILFDYGSEGYSFQDKEFPTVKEAVRHAFDLNYYTKFLIVQVVDWEATEKCPHDDCWKVHYKDCPTHGLEGEKK